MKSSKIKTTCAYCGVGCGITVDITNESTRQIEVQGDESHPANFGKLCSKGSALGETLALEGRLLQPQINNSPTDWEHALSAVAARFQHAIQQYGPDSVAFYVSGQLLTEDYYVANKMMKGFIGSANIDTNSRLCMSSAVAGHKRAFGADSVPASYDDLDEAKLIVLVGSNTAWCHPIVFQRIRAQKEKRPDLKVVVIDPRRTATCDIADLHLPIRAGTDVALFNGLLNYIALNQLIDAEFIRQHTDHFSEALAAAKRSGSLEEIAAQCEIHSSTLKSFYQLFVKTAQTVTLFSQGVNQSSHGTDKANAIINCHLATGRIGKPGQAPFSITGQPNAMGGREVGGLANQLAAHMDITDATHRSRVQRFWNAPVIAERNGYKAVELFDRMLEGKIKAVWVMATNPVVSLPNADKIKEALQKCEFVVVSDCIEHTDTSAFAHVKLPACGWGEKDGTVTNSERRISRQRAFLPPAGESKPDWWIIAEVAKRMGYADAFNYRTAADVFREHARLSGFENDEQNGIRDFDISALTEISNSEYDALAPVQWPLNKKNPQGTVRLFEDKVFFTTNRRAQFIAVENESPANLTSKNFPLILNSGRIRDQWHTMTRTGLTPRLISHISESFLEIHPDDAAAVALKENDIARISSRWGEAFARIQFSDHQKRGHVFMPIHWTEQLTTKSRVGATVNPAVDPISGQPELKHTPVQVSMLAAKTHGFILLKSEPTLPNLDYACKIRLPHGWRIELAHSETFDVLSWLQHHLQQDCETRMEYVDASANVQRLAVFDGSALAAIAFLADRPLTFNRNWMQQCLAQTSLSDTDRISLLSGQPADPALDEGKTVCSCFGVGAKKIERIIVEQNATSVEAIGKCCKAGTNCGSCVPELKSILHAMAQNSLSKTA